MLKHTDTYHLFHKDKEFGVNICEGMAVRVATSKNLTERYSILEGDLKKGQIVPVITEGSTIVKDLIRQGSLLLYDYPVTNGTGASSSPDFVDWKVEETVSLPPAARHGCVSLLTPEEAKALTEALRSNPSVQGQFSKKAALFNRTCGADSKCGNINERLQVKPIVRWP